MTNTLINIIDSFNISKYAVKDSDELKSLIESFKDVVTSDWQLNDVQADSETYRIKQLVCTCQMLANISENTNAAKQIFNDYANCRYMKVDANGKICINKNIQINYVSIDKDGRVFLEWMHESCIKAAHPCFAEVDVVYKADDEYVEGIFTCEDEAMNAAKDWFHMQKLEEIAELEAKLAELKKKL